METSVQRSRLARAIARVALIAWGAVLLYWAATADLCTEDFGCPGGHLGMWWRITLVVSSVLFGASGVAGLVAVRSSEHETAAHQTARFLLLAAGVAFLVWVDLHFQVTNQTSN
jgi:hypothetical protein